MSDSLESFSPVMKEAYSSYAGLSPKLDEKDSIVKRIRKRRNPYGIPEDDEEAMG